MSDKTHKDLIKDRFKRIFTKATKEKVKKASTKLYPVSEKDIELLKESGTNSYSSDNKKMIKALKA